MSLLSQNITIPGNQSMENYFSNSIVPQLFVDPDMVLRSFTIPAGEIFSISHEDIGKSLYHIKEKITHNALIENIRGVLLVEKNKEKEIQTSDGRWFHMNVQPCFDQQYEQINGVIVTYLELTGQVKIMKELERLNAQHETLLFALSHDLKQPLSTIILLSDALLESYKGEDIVLLEKWLERLKRTSKNIKFLIEQLTTTPDFTDNTNRSGIRVSFQDAYREVLGLLREEVQIKNFIIDTDFDVNDVLFSKNNLRSIIYNLLGNAIKYKDSDRNLEILIKTRRIGTYIILNIQDNGIGISKEDQGRIFNKSTRFNKDIEGTGMGLYIIKRMIESSFGKIEVDSRIGKGSNFKLYFRE